jgi:ACR3 family arsenite efflux pump ArsB
MWLARRVPDQWIVKRATTYRWLLPVLTTVGVLLIGLGPLIALVLYWNLLDRMRKHLKAIVATGAPADLPSVAG